MFNLFTVLTQNSQHLPFLKQNINRTLKPLEWANLFDFLILDPDGWRDKNAPDFDKEVGLQEFIERASRCTISPRKNVPERPANRVVI